MRGKKIDGFPGREQALKDFMAEWKPEDRTEFVPVSEAAGRVTAEELHSVLTLPVFRSSGCDGIAVKSSRFQNGVPDISGWTAGKEFERADTGDDFDDRFDAVIPIEETDISPDGRLTFISPDEKVIPGYNVRPKGSMVKEDDLLMRSDLPVRPTDQAALIMGGITMVPVRKKPVVAFIPTGSELVPETAVPKRGQNVDTNSCLLRSTLTEMGAEPLIFPIVPDNPGRLEQVLDRALAAADAVILNAGTAKGEEDFNTGLLKKKGKLIHHYVAAAPGRPMALAVIGGKPVINLPGPSMAAYFGADWCVRALVSRFLHIPVRKKQKIRGILMEDICPTPHMAILIRMNAVRKNGRYELYPVSFRQAGMPECLTTNAQYVSEVGESERKRGEEIEAELLRGEEYAGDVS